MSRLFLYILISFLVFFLLSCRKYTMKTNVEGTVVDFTTGNSIPYAKVEIHATGQSSDIFSSAPYKGVQYTIDANAEGEFSFEFKANKEYSYYVTAKKDNYFFDEFPGTTPDDIYVSIENAKKNRNAKVKLKPKAWLKINIHNISPFDMNDEFYLNPFNVWGGGQFIGISVDTFISGIVDGNYIYAFPYLVTKNNIQTQFSASVYCIAFDTTIFIINY